MKNKNRINIYLPEDEHALFEQVADKLHKEGVKGMFKSDGKPNQSAIVAHLLKREISTSEPK